MCFYKEARLYWRGKIISTQRYLFYLRIVFELITRCTTAIKCLMIRNQEVIGSSPIYTLCVVAQLDRALHKQCTPALRGLSITAIIFGLQPKDRVSTTLASTLSYN